MYNLCCIQEFVSDKEEFSEKSANTPEVSQVWPSSSGHAKPLQQRELHQILPANASVLPFLSTLV